MEPFPTSLEPAIRHATHDETTGFGLESMSLLNGRECRRETSAGRRLVDIVLEVVLRRLVLDLAALRLVVMDRQLLAVGR